MRSYHDLFIFIMYRKLLHQLSKSALNELHSPCQKFHVNVDKTETKHPDYLWGPDPNAIDIVKENFKVYKNFVSESEEEKLMKEIDPIFKRRRYQFDHWDGAIQGYKETEKQEWNDENYKVLKRLREISFTSKSTLIPHVHVLDLSKTGFIKPHIDSVKFCGNTIAGISLLSSSVMRLVSEDRSVTVDVLLERRSLYIMRGIVRYEFTHEILNESSSSFKGLPVARDRRVSIICRNESDGKGLS